MRCLNDSPKLPDNEILVFNLFSNAILNIETACEIKKVEITGRGVRPNRLIGRFGFPEVFVRDDPLVIALQNTTRMILFYRWFSSVQADGLRATLAQDIRSSGMVEEGSLARSENSLTVRFVVSDLSASAYPLTHIGILPDLFREGQGISIITSEQIH